MIFMMPDFGIIAISKLLILQIHHRMLCFSLRSCFAPVQMKLWSFAVRFWRTLRVVLFVGVNYVAICYGIPSADLKRGNRRHVCLGTCMLCSVFKPCDCCELCEPTNI